MITSDKGSGDASGTQVDGGVEVHVDPLVSQGGTDDYGFPGFQDLLPDLDSGYLGHQGKTLALIAPATIPMMKMATQESMGRWRAEGAAVR